MQGSFKWRKYLARESSSWHNLHHLNVGITYQNGKKVSYHWSAVDRAAHLHGRNNRRRG